jgi:hypothetical protein
MGKEQINPQVVELLVPIIQNTTNLYKKQKMLDAQPLYSQVRINDTEDEKRAKRECMHMIFNEDGTLKYIPEDCDKEGYKRCPVCKKYIPLKFEEKNVQTLLDAIDVLNQIAFFGAMMNLKADRIKTLIALKAILPDVVQLAHELNTFVTLDQNTAESMDSIATEYTDRMGLTNWG